MDNQFAIGVVIAPTHARCCRSPWQFADRVQAAPVTSLTIVAIRHPFPGRASVPSRAGPPHQVCIPLEAIVGGIDGAKNRARNYAIITMGWSAANFLGPLIAGFSIDYIGQLQVYLVLAVLTVAPIPILLLRPAMLTKVAAMHTGDGARGSVLELWRIPSVRMTIIAAGVVGSAQDLFQFYLPICHSIGFRTAMDHMAWCCWLRSGDTVVLKKLTARRY
jgi:hypothetical protein